MNPGLAFSHVLSFALGLGVGSSCLPGNSSRAVMPSPRYRRSDRDDARVLAIRRHAVAMFLPTLAGEASPMSVNVPRSPVAVAVHTACLSSSDHDTIVTLTPVSPFSCPSHSSPACVTYSLPCSFTMKPFLRSSCLLSILSPVVVVGW